MIPLSEFADLSKALKTTKIMLDLEKIPGNKTFLGMCILNAVKNKTVRPDEVINFIKQQYRDNESVTVQVVGEDLALEICEF